jgi:hypothetical protein
MPRWAWAITSARVGPVRLASSTSLVELPVDWAVRVNGPEVDGMAAVGKHDRLAGGQAAGAGGGCGRGRCYPTCPTRLLGATPPAQGCGHEQYQQRE